MSGQLSLLKRAIVTIITIVALHNTGFAQSPENSQKEVYRLEAIPDEKAALSKAVDALKTFPENIFLLTKASELYCRVGAREKKGEPRNAYYRSALTLAKKALQLAPQSDLSYTAMAMSTGVAILELSNKEKIKGVRELKSYAEKAVQLNPGNATAWHILGRWHYEVTNLSGFERAAVKIFYGGLPDASVEKAIMFYAKANSLRPDFILNKLELARAYIKTDQDEKAKDILLQLRLAKSKTEDDPDYKLQAEKMLGSLK